MPIFRTTDFSAMTAIVVMSIERVHLSTIFQRFYPKKIYFFKTNHKNLSNPNINNTKKTSQLPNSQSGILSPTTFPYRKINYSHNRNFHTNITTNEKPLARISSHTDFAILKISICKYYRLI